MILANAEAKNPVNPVAEIQSSLGPTTICPVYSETGKCKHGFKCRFLGAHVKVARNGISDESSLVVDGDKVAHAAVSAVELNFVDPDVRKQLRTRKVMTFHSVRGRSLTDALHCGTARLPTHVQYPRPVSDAYLKEIQQSSGVKDEEIPESPDETEVNPIESSGVNFETSTPPISSQDVDMSQADTPDTPVRFVEKKRLHWNGKTCKWFHPIERLR